MAVAANTMRVRGIAETLRELDRELGDNGKVYRRTVREIKRAGDLSVTRARGFLPADDAIHPSGFAYKNTQRFRRETGNMGADRAFPRYDKMAAASSIRVISAREKSQRTDTGWRAGKMYGISVEMRDPAGSIYDVAGNAKSKRQRARNNNDPKSRQFVTQIKRSWVGLPQWNFRVVLPAVVDTRDDVIKQIYRILDDSRRTLDASRDASWRTIK